MAKQAQVTKKLINSPETCVDDQLRGLVATYPQLRLHPQHRVVTVRNKMNVNRVALLGGGGSGHEPFASGYIGAGMLDGVIAGEVFASPPAGNALYAIKHLNKYYSGGILFFFGNYTGDRLNFGKAIEKAKAVGIKVESFIVAEDIASSKNKTGGRSMVGEVVLYKICGAMAAQGFEFNTIFQTATEVHQNMATLGVSLTSCSLPGQSPLFEVAADQVELGAGVHGEAGIGRLKMGTAKEMVEMILDKIIEFLKINPGDKVVATINNMGGTSILEMNVLSAETKQYLDKQKIAVERIYTGHFKTALEMQGFQICLLKLISDKANLWLKMLDAPTEAAGWTGTKNSMKSEEKHFDDDNLLENDEQLTALGPLLNAKEQEIFRGSLTAAAKELIEQETLLNKLDSGCGDGDCGSTLKKFARAALNYLETISLENPAKILWDLSELAETDMGGTSGGIYSLGLSAASQTLAGHQSSNRKTWWSALDSAMRAITKYGGAEPGDRTMLDTLHVAGQVFEENMDAEESVLLVKLSDAVEEGATSTAGMVARAGRASYVANEYMKEEDAGARAVAIWLQAIIKYMIKS